MAAGEFARATVGSACYNAVIGVPIFHGIRRLDAAVVSAYGRPA
jgi:hypothetical protein